MNNLFKAMMMLCLILMVMSPVLAQDDEPDSPITVIESADGETTVILADGVQGDNYSVIGMVVVAVISITVIVVNGFTTGRYFEAFEKSTRYLIDNKPLSDAIESRVSRWDEKHRRYANTLLDIVDKQTTFSWTDTDDAFKAWYRDMFDGVVEPEAVLPKG